MRKLGVLSTIAALAAALLPLAASADVDPSLIPDGTYTVKVTRVVDSNHMTIVLPNKLTATVAAVRPSLDFSKIKSNDNVMLSLGKGKVLVFKDLSQ